MRKKRHLGWKALLAAEESWPPYGCIQSLQKEARQKALSSKESLSAPQRSKPLGCVIYAQHIYEAFVIDSVNQNREMRAKFIPEIIKLTLADSAKSLF